MKQRRHNAIRDILAAGAIPNQDEFRKKLAAKGFHVTQATLSRDIHELRLSKGPAGYALESNGDAEDFDAPEIKDTLENFGLEVRQAQNLIVIVTRTGGAQPVAAGIDYEDWPEVVGTIAGDDTVLVICPDTRTADTLRARVEGYIG